MKTMKKSCLVDQRSMSPSKSVRFGSDYPAGRSPSDVVNDSKMADGLAPEATGSSTLGAYVGQLKRALRRRPEDLNEVIDAIRDILRTTAAEQELVIRNGKCVRPTMRKASTTPIDLIGRIERIVTLLEGSPTLVSGLAAILPPEYSIDVQPDAVVVKVYEADGDCSMVDTGHSRTVDGVHQLNGDDLYGMSSPSSPLTSSSRYRPSSPRNLRRRLSARRNGGGSGSFRRKTMTSSSPAYTSGGNFLLSSSPGPRMHLTGLRGPLGGSRRTGTTRSTADSVAEAAVVGGVFSDGTSRGSMSSQASRSSASRRKSAPINGSPTRTRRRRSPNRTWSSPNGTPTRPASSAATWPASTATAAVRRLVISPASAAGSRRRADDTDGVATGGMAYMLEIKRALAHRPNVYRKFLGYVKRYNEQRNGAGSTLNGSGNHHQPEVRGSDNEDDDDESTHGQLGSIREIVTLLRDQPQLVLGFNDFLPDGYRIRMFDRSAYVIDYPLLAVTTIGGGRDVGVGRLTVPI